MSDASKANQDQVVTLRLLRQLKRGGKRFKAADSTGVKLSAIDLLVRTLALRRFLLREVFAADEQQVGIFLPPTVPAVATNFAVTLAGKVAVNLNYTASNRVLAQCSEAAGLKRVLTSRRFLEKVELDPGAPTLCLEDVRPRIRLSDKLVAWVQAHCYSPERLHARLGLGHLTADDLLTLVFTSGSTGVPKGVMLTHGNIYSNIDGIEKCIKLDEHDVVLGILPFFHSFGYTVTLWAAMTLPCAAVYHYSPLDARVIGKLAEQYGVTVLLATPTFLRSYLRRIEPEQFRTLEVVVLGAEKMPVDLAEAFEQRFGVRPMEGYGTTELSPVVAVNIPPSRSAGDPHEGWREGSIGRPLPGVEVRVVSIDTDEPLPVGETGLIEVRGPNVMKGYWQRPDLTAEVMHDGWYRTGDVGYIDEDGFIYITGRLSRFSKIGGEMVPHIQVEEAINQILGVDEEGTLRVAVTAIPDERKGERLVVLHTGLPCSPAELVRRLAETGLPNLYLPDEQSFVQVDEIPILGSGKLDLRRIREIALEHFGQS
ncbi:MAG: hypothetical protein KatS3mg111_2621 [Pirellulaceae bacterium]|nr:MAG: hypothetical protein KatS3mg111_2621 [Pirellulaceae bacterium]